MHLPTTPTLPAASAGIRVYNVALAIAVHSGAFIQDGPADRANNPWYFWTLDKPAVYDSVENGWRALIDFLTAIADGASYSELMADQTWLELAAFLLHAGGRPASPDDEVIWAKQVCAMLGVDPSAAMKDYLAPANTASVAAT